MTNRMQEFGGFFVRGLEKRRFSRAGGRELGGGLSQPSVSRIIGELEALGWASRCCWRTTRRNHGHGCRDVVPSIAPAKFLVRQSRTAEDLPRAASIRCAHQSLTHYHRHLLRAEFIPHGWPSFLACTRCCASRNGGRR